MHRGSMGGNDSGGLWVWGRVRRGDRGSVCDKLCVPGIPKESGKYKAAPIRNSWTGMRPGGGERAGALVLSQQEKNAL